MPDPPQMRLSKASNRRRDQPRMTRKRGAQQLRHAIIRQRENCQPDLPQTGVHFNKLQQTNCIRMVDNPFVVQFRRKRIEPSQVPEQVSLHREGLEGITKNAVNRPDMGRVLEDGGLDLWGGTEEGDGVLVDEGEVCPEDWREGLVPGMANASAEGEGVRC